MSNEEQNESQSFLEQLANQLSSAPQSAENNTQLKNLANLQENWDGYGSQKITPKALALASIVLNLELPYSSPYYLIPMSSGGIMIEWQEAELEIMPDGSVEFVRTNEEFIHLDALGVDLLLEAFRKLLDRLNAFVNLQNEKLDQCK